MLPKLESTEPMQKKHLPERMEQPAPGFCKKSLFYLPKTNGGHPPIQSLDHLSLALKTEEERVAELTKREAELKKQVDDLLNVKTKEAELNRLKSKQILLNVGGSHYTTTLATLRSDPFSQQNLNIHLDDMVEWFKHL